MVKVRQEQPLLVDGSVNIEMWLCKIGDDRPEINLSRLRDACELSEQAEEKAIASSTVWALGHSSFRTGLEMAEILNELRVDEDALVAAIIYRAVRENQLTINHVRKQYGDEVAKLIEGALKMAAISDIQFGGRKKVLGERMDQMEQARRMLVSLVDDVRVALLKLAERTCAIRNAAKNNSPKAHKLSREVVEIYAPLAHRLGIGHLKWELEDLAFRIQEPLPYKRIANLLDEKRTARQEYIGEVVDEIMRRLRQFGLDANVTGRPKHIYSIWRKMRRKGIPFSEVYDVRAVRILVDKPDDCYRVLGVVHNLWRNIPHEFDDYIANPKENGYQSLHTAVIGPEGKVLEIQIRTVDMHEEAEFGICSHWQYKDGDHKKGSESYEQRLAWLRTIIDGTDEGEAELDIASEMSIDRIYVFTPGGDVIDMTPGATAIDFAYRVHTEIGHKCRGVKLNGRVVPLNTELNSGDRIEIIVGEEAEPRREWLHEHLGYVATSRARAKIQGWFARRERQKNVDEGKKMLIEELSHLGVENLDFSALVDRVGYESANDLFYAISIGSLSAYEVVEEAADLVNLDMVDHQLNLGIEEGGGESSMITGQGDLDCTMAECCQPVPGDLIVGVADDEELVHVHRQDCLQALRADVYGRMMRLEWTESVENTFPVSIEVAAYDRFGLLHDITGILMREQTNVLSVVTHTNKQNNRVSLKMVIEVSQLNRLLQTLEKIEQQPNVMSAKRTISPT